MINSAARSLVSGKKWYRNISAGNPLYSEMELISTVLVGTGGSSTIAFSSIPQDYKHLQLRVVSRSSRTYNGNAVDVIYIKLNSVDATKSHFVLGNGTSVSSFSDTYSALTVDVSSPPTQAGAYSASVFDLLDYTSTTKNKTIRALSGFIIPNNGTNDIGHVALTSTLFASTSATTSISLLCLESFVAGSRFSLYGIKG